MQGKNWSNRVSIKLKLTKGNSYKIISIWLFQYWRTEKLIYIPIWLYSNGLSFIDYLAPQKRLHSYLVIFKWFQFGMVHIILYVYIPIWLYSNAYEKEQIGWIQEFTFQYGYIQITALIKMMTLTQKFTFQYGYIQIAHVTKCTVSKASLHSNMVIFK